ncbi:anaerobic ribonucleoside triphosphate reductase [Paenibacillus sp. PDC88]|uniref:anaerobic ribonucleoside triphosphate reductase n=1 Tax=Paenibacillus sp. PDC88 TaxID=1884375 RepID=UPI000894AC3D|nr:ribonucleoside-triphosphate reductase class III catalytic subunit [Paenibacillus sp. PDC88]
MAQIEAAMTVKKESDDLTDIIKRIIDSKEQDVLRENANLNGDSFSGKMSKIGSEASKEYALKHILPPYVARAVEQGYIYVHDLDQYALGTTNCIFIPFDRLLERGFNTGNGSVRTPRSIMSAMALVAIIFQSQQNSQFGGVSASKIDWDLAPYVNRSFIKHYRKGQQLFEETGEIEDVDIHFASEKARTLSPKSFTFAHDETITETRQAAESLIHNLNTMSSRAGGQIPFTSLNYGMCTSPEGRLVSHSLLDAAISGLGHGETPVFPQHIFQCKQGVNQREGDPNYDLFLKAVDCTSRRLYPNFINIDASFNLPYYREGEPDTIMATMGCRTRTIADRFGRNRLSGKGNLSFNTVNLVKLGIEQGIILHQRHAANLNGFYKNLHYSMETALSGLLHRYSLQSIQPAKASDFMMREGVWEGGDQLHPDEPVGNLLKHGTLSIGFIGLAECLKALLGQHHGESELAYNEGLKIIETMRAFCDRKSEEYNLNITLFATPAEGLSGKFTQMDREQYGQIPEVTDREYYTNSFHVPVYYSISSARKIELEAPFHELCNAGAISYVELDGNVRHNQIALRKIIQYALTQNMGYFSVNHPIDRCPDCGYEGVIGTTCPSCGVTEEQVHFSRLRRVTGYLTGDYTLRFNEAKQAEVRDRVKHQ